MVAGAIRPDGYVSLALRPADPRPGGHYVTG